VQRAVHVRESVTVPVRPRSRERSLLPTFPPRGAAEVRPPARRAAPRRAPPALTPPAAARRRPAAPQRPAPPSFDAQWEYRQ